jgi:hypothetical protein
VNFFDAHGLAGKDRAEINLFATQTDSTASGDDVVRLASKDKRLVKLARDWNLLQRLDTKPGLQEANHVVKTTQRYTHAPEGERVKKP